MILLVDADSLVFASCYRKRENKDDYPYYTDLDDAIAKFEHYERKIDDLESQVDAYDLVSETQSLSSQIQQLEQDDNIEKELAAIRKKVA